MPNRLYLNPLAIMALLVFCAQAGDMPETQAGHSPDTPGGPAPAKQKAYEDLFSEIMGTLPREGLDKVDSARGSGPAKATPTARPATPEELARRLKERRDFELGELPPAVKDRVDRVLSDLQDRRNEKALEFKELK